jgi:hypothetical protein
MRAMTNGASTWISEIHVFRDTWVEQASLDLSWFFILGALVPHTTFAFYLIILTFHLLLVPAFSVLRESGVPVNSPDWIARLGLIAFANMASATLISLLALPVCVLWLQDGLAAM